ncbi:MAG: hypothetical protein JO076_02410, partial [Verrucomicrobia bacterium]|nr:hypothetical protein [Verrucomicrobiota bacterium]
MEQTNKSNWPVLRYYDQEHSLKIALPIGGIGTGTVSLGGRGDLRDWEIVNRPAKGFAPTHAFFALRTATEGGQPIAKALEGRIPTELYEGWSGSPVFNAGMPRFQQHSFETTYPFGRVILKDSEMPVDVHVEAFNPLVPGDADASGIPLAVLRFKLVNNTTQEISASVCGVLQNFIGQDGSLGKSVRNRNRFRADSGLQGMVLSSDGVNPKSEQWGTLALTTTAKGPVSFRTSWADLSWGNTLLDFWDDFVADGRLDDRVAPKNNSPIASLAVPVEVPPEGENNISFLLTWHFPNRLSWRAPDRNPQTWSEDLELIGNYYATKYMDAWDVAEKALPRLEQLELLTTKFVTSLYASDLPDKVKEAALFNISTLRTQTCFRTPDGYLFGWEGCQDLFGSCFGSCTHVWNYEQATAYLFGDLAKGMREVEFLHATDSRGLMSFRVNLPLVHGKEFGVAAADG